MKKLILLCLFLPFVSNAQKYLVLFKDKANSPYSTTKPSDYLSAKSLARRTKQGIKVLERDLPPNPSYVNQVIANGGKVWYKSRWLNGVVLEADSLTLQKILKLSFVKGIDGGIKLKNNRQSAYNQVISTNKFAEIFSTTDFGTSQNQLNMLGVDKMFTAGFHGEGMYIAVLDNGFLNVNNISFFKHLFTENRIVDTYDFVGNKKNVYDAGEHGVHCFSCLAAYTDSKIVGTAYKANYALFHTEDDDSETRLEEANWLIAAERADSLGVDIISTSLGYNQFDASWQDYTYQDMNGHKALISRAADVAANVGMLVVAAAGNEGGKAWHYITAPADADSIIAVGAVNGNLIYAAFSSVGPSADGRIKPDLAAQGSGTTIGLSSDIVSNGSGTSYATPLLAGMAAGFWQAYPNLTAMQVRSYLIKSGNQYKAPDNKLGYGVPNFQTAYDIAKKDFTPLSNEYSRKNEGNIAIIYPNPSIKDKDILLKITDDDTSPKYELHLIDSFGREIWAGISEEKNFNLPLNKSVLLGEYYLKISSKNINSTLKIVISD